MSGPSSSDKAQERDISNRQLALGEKQDARADKTFGLTYPGMEKAENWYTGLASGDPQKIQASIAPAASNIASQIEGAKQNITANMPRGGEQRLALEQADVAKAGKIGDLSTSAYTSSFPALANLGTSGIGLSINQVATALSGMQGAATSTNNIMSQDSAGKAATMGLLGGVAQGAGTAAGGALSNPNRGGGGGGNSGSSGGK